MSALERLFSVRYNRAFGLHLPFGSRQAAAIDPYIRGFRLKPLLNDPAVNTLAAENLLQRRTDWNLGAYAALLSSDLPLTFKERALDVIAGNINEYNVAALSRTALKSPVPVELKKWFLSECIERGNDRSSKTLRMDSPIFSEDFFRMLSKLTDPEVQQIQDIWEQLLPNMDRQIYRVTSTSAISPDLSYMYTRGPVSAMATYFRLAYTVKERKFLIPEEYYKYHWKGLLNS